MKFLFSDQGNKRKVDITHLLCLQEKAKQVNRIRSLFHRQLSVPLVDLKSTLMAYKLWEVEQGNVKDVDSADMDGIPSNVVSSYQKAMEMYTARTIYEDPLLNQDATDNDKLQHFMVSERSIYCTWHFSVFSFLKTIH